MRYLRFIIVTVWMLFLFFSCQSGSKENIRVENIWCHPICGDDYIIGGPRAMALSDSILVIVDNKSDSMLLFFDIKAGKYLRKAGVRGHGPTEFTMISSLRPYDKGVFSFYDPNQRTYYTCTLTDDGVQFTSLFRADSILSLEVCPIANERFIATGIYDDFRFCLLGLDGQVQSSFGEWPYRDEVEKKVSGEIRSQAYMFNIAVSPSKTKFLAYLLSSDILAFYQLDGDSVRLIKEAVTSYPDYKYRNNPTIYSGTSKNTPLTYKSATCSEDYVYLLYSGRTFQEHGLGVFSGNIIYVYTWSGEKIAMLKSDKLLQDICLSEDGKSMYAIANDPDPVLVHFTLPQWLIQ